MSTTAAETQRINPKIIVPFVDSVQAVFSTMVGVQTRTDRPHIKVEPTPTYDVSSIIGFSGGVTGLVVVSFQRSAAEKLVTAFAGQPVSPDSPDFADAVGELANMIVGGAKKHLGNMSSITVPSVIIGANHVVARLSDVPCIVIPCRTDIGDFAVEVSIKQCNPADD